MTETSHLLQNKKSLHNCMAECFLNIKQITYWLIIGKQIKTRKNAGGNLNLLIPGVIDESGHPLRTQSDDALTAFCSLKILNDSIIREAL